MKPPEVKKNEGVIKVKMFNLVHSNSFQDDLHATTSKSHPLAIIVALKCGHRDAEFRNRNLDFTTCVFFVTPQPSVQPGPWRAHQK